MHFVSLRRATFIRQLSVPTINRGALKVPLLSRKTFGNCTGNSIRSNCWDRPAQTCASNPKQVMDLQRAISKAIGNIRLPLALKVRRVHLGHLQSIVETIAKTHLQYLMIATAINFKRIFHWLSGVPQATTRTRAICKAYGSIGRLKNISPPVSKLREISNCLLNRMRVKN